MSPTTVLSAVALAAAAIVAVGGCSDDEPAACVSVEELRSSVDDLQDLSLADDGLTAVQEQIATVRENAATARTEVAAELAPETDAVTGSIEALQSALATAVTPAEQAEVLAADLPTVRSALDALVTAVEETCD